MGGHKFSKGHTHSGRSICRSSSLSFMEMGSETGSGVSKNQNPPPVPDLFLSNLMIRFHQLVSFILHNIASKKRGEHITKNKRNKQGILSKSESVSFLSAVLPQGILTRSVTPLSPLNKRIMQTGSACPAAVSSANSSKQFTIQFQKVFRTQ